MELEMIGDGQGHADKADKADKAYHDTVHTYPRHGGCSPASLTIPNPCILETWCPRPCHLQPQNRIHVPFFPFTRISTEHETSFHIRLSPGRQWPDGTDKSSPRTILTGLYKLPAGQLGTAPPSSRICIQQCRKCNHWHLPVLCEQGLPPKAVDEPASPLIVLRGSTLHGGPGPTTLPIESVDRRGPGMLPESSGYHHQPSGLAI